MPKLKPYQKYKPSNIQWLGDVPEHWEVCRLKYCVSQFISGGTPSTDNPSYWSDDSSGTPWVAIGDMTRSYHLQDTMKRITASGLSSKKLTIIPAGTLLYSMYASLGKVALLQIDAVVNQAILGIIADHRRAQRDFLCYWLEFMQLHVVMLSSSSTQDNLNAEKVRGMTVCLPPRDEQRAIARYPDHITSRIDTYTSNKRKLVELLKEYRQALIHQTVTRGLNPDERDSGVEPMIRLHYLITVNSGARIQFEPDKGDMDAAVSIGGEHIQNYEFSLGDKTRFVPLSFYLDQKSGHIQHGDTLVVKDGATIGKSMFVDHMPAEHMMVNEHVFVLRAVLIDPRYLSFLIQEKTTQDTIWSLVYGAAQPGLSKNFVKFIRVPCVGLEEQRAIADYLDRKTDKIDTAIDLAQREIELLEEYRTRLIADVVTGQLDVRDQNVPATPT